MIIALHLYDDDDDEEEDEDKDDYDDDDPLPSSSIWPASFFSSSSAQAIFCIMIIAAIHGSDYLLVVGFSFFNLFSPFPELNAS